MVLATLDALVAVRIRPTGLVHGWRTLFGMPQGLHHIELLPSAPTSDSNEMQRLVDQPDVRVTVLCHL
jgi:hypothetical protein